MFSTTRKRLGTGLATALILSATIAPGAIAQPTDRGAPDVRDAPSRVVVSSSASGFDWGSAGIGAGTVVGAFAVALAGTVGLRRRRRPSEAL
jgi:hypothetical protein